MMAEAAVQIQRFVYVTPMSSWVRTQNILINVGKHIMRFSRFSKGHLLLMRVLIGRTLALITWQLCINVRCSPTVLLLYPCCYQKEGESGHFQPVLATSLWASCMIARMRLVQEGFKPLPNRYLVTQTLDQSTWQRREQRRPQLRPLLQPRKR